MTKPLETCITCHGDGAAFEAVVAHAVTGMPTVGNVQFAVANVTDLVVTYNLKVDGVNSTDFTTVQRDYRTIADGTRFDLGTITAATSTGSGNYSITIPGGAAAAGTASRYMFRVANSAGLRAVVVEDFPAAPWTDQVSNQSCINCHGETGIPIHGGGYAKPAGMEVCTVCHKSTAYTFEDPWVGIIHGVHNSHNMPSGHYEYAEDEIFSVTYPTYMTNCSVCHDDSSKLAAANSMTVSGANCFTCHESMESWEEGFVEAGVDWHLDYDETTNCAICHDGDVAPATVTGLHNGLETERVGLIWEGEDLSVKEGKNFTWTIDSVVDNGTNLTIKWSATYKGVAVDPCNSTITATAPGFFNVPQPDGSLGFLRSYAQGDDFILGKASSPGQPTNVNLNTTNTTCAANVATTVLPVEAGVAAGTRGILALQGKPQLALPTGFEPGEPPYYEWPALYVRVPTPTREFIVGTGALPTEQRRDVVDTEQCLKCHVGSLYQHGNTRVDNVGMCILCHNSASSEQNVRVGMGVTASEAYDGKVGQTFEMKTMLHAIHSSGETMAPIVIYRNRGIYAWAGSEDQLPNWPGASVDSTDKKLVYGADPANPNSMQLHTFYSPTYPRELNDCAACHPVDFGTGAFGQLPDQRKAVATTLDAGVAPWTNQLDDVLEGASAAACMSCHQSADSFGQAVLKGHAYQNGWEPKTFPNGRQTIIDAAK